MADPTEPPAPPKATEAPAPARRRSPRAEPKGRQLDDAAVTEVRALLGERPRRRDLLIEHLHLIQDAYGRLSAAHLRALADEMRLAQAEVYEVATFYAHFDVIKDDGSDPARWAVRVCESLPCAMAGAEALVARLSADYAAEGQVRILRAPCMGRCAAAPAAMAGRHALDQATAEKVADALRGVDAPPALPDYQRLDMSLAGGGYETLKALRSGARTPQALQEDVSAAGLRGLGGAGFPAGRKWGFVRAEPGPRYLAVNGDEGEPGTFKDRYFLEREPHVFLEGALIAAWAIEAAGVYIYMRDEYPAVLEILVREIAALEAAGIAAPGFVELRRGAGAYICGEESAMIESIEGKRGLPRHRPPYVAQVGLFGRPTLVHNVETLHWVAKIAREGPSVFNAHGENGRVGLRSFSVSGRVSEPGVKIAPAGISLRRLIDDYCGGMAAGHQLKAFLPGGASGGILPAALADVPLDFDTLQPHGAFIGSAAVIVLSDQDSVRDAAINVLKFFEEESCGQCTPCRVGCAKAVQLMQAGAWDATLLEDLAQAMEDASICGLGQAAPNPIRAVLKHWPDEAGVSPTPAGPR